MTASHQRALEVLRDIDSRFHRLLEAVADADEITTTPTTDPIATLRRTRAQIDAVLFEHHRRTTDGTLPDGGSCVLQWDPPTTPPRRLVFDPNSGGNSWTRRELEWTGESWRVCGSDSVNAVAIRAPAEPRYPNPVDPPTIDTLLEWIRDSWHNPDPPALVFDATAKTEQGVLVAVDGELRYREADSDHWCRIIDETDLYHHIKQQGQPAVQSLSETSLTPQHFTPSPLTE